MKKTVKIFSPIHQQFTFLLYCKYVFDFDEISFENKIYKNSGYKLENFIDIEFLKGFSESNIDKKLRYTIFFWNGQKQYTENLHLINLLKKTLNKNLNLFFVGNAIDIDNVKFAKLSGNEKKFRFKNTSLRNRIAFKYPLFFSFISILKDGIKFFKYNNQPKICFTGLVKINDNFISHLIKDWNFSNESKLVLNDLKKIYKSACINNETIDKFSIFLNSAKYNGLPPYEKYFMSQIIFRNCLCNILQQNKYFYLQDWDDRAKFMDNLFYKKFVFLDLGSTAGNDFIYFRYLVLRFFKKRSLRINFFDKYDKINFVAANKDIINYFKKLKNLNIKKLEFSQLLDAIKSK